MANETTGETVILNVALGQGARLLVLVAEDETLTYRLKSRAVNIEIDFAEAQLLLAARQAVATARQARS